MRRLFFTFASLALLHVSTATAQGGPPMLTDDPGTPGDGHWEINIATLDQRNGDATYQLPLLDINYGLGERVQLKFELPWLIQDSRGHDGSGDSLAGIKWRFYDTGENAWQISMYPQAEFATPLARTSHAGLARSSTSFLLPLEFERNFSGGDVTVELGRWIRAAGQDDSWIAGVVLGHEFRQGFEMLVELHEEKSTHFDTDELTINVGARWEFSKRYSLLLSAGRDLHNTLSATSTLISYLGLQMRL